MPSGSTVPLLLTRLTETGGKIDVVSDELSSVVWFSPPPAIVALFVIVLGAFSATFTVNLMSE